MTLVGNRPEWVYAMVACWRLGAVAQPCTEQLRPADLRARMEAVEPRAIVAEARNVELATDAGFDGPLLVVPDERLFEAEPAPVAELGARGSGADRVHVGHLRRAEADPPRRALPGRPARPGRALVRGPPGDLCWCTAASGWSLSARNAFVAAWLRGAAALLHDARFDAASGSTLLERERVNVLCMSPTEYRAIAKRGELRRLPALRHAVAAGEPLNPEVVRDLAGGRRGVRARRLRPDRDRPPHRDADRPAGEAGVDGPAAAGLPGLDRRGRAGGRPRHRAHLLHRRRPRPALAHRRPRQRGRGRLPLVRGPHRRRDHLRRLPDRAVRGGVGAGGPPGGGRGGGRGGAGRGARPGGARGGGAAAGLRARRRARAGAPGPREGARPRPTSTRAWWTSRSALPKTPSGKIKRAALRG